MAGSSSAPAKDLTLPRTDDGAPISFIYGRCMSRAPIVAWVGSPGAIADPGGLTGDTFWQGSPFLYDFEALYIVGIPFSGINSDNRVHAIYAGEQKIPDIGSTAHPTSPTFTALPYVALGDLQGDGGYEWLTRPCNVSAHPDIAATQGAEFEIGGLVEFLNGNTDQQLVNPTTPFAPTTVAGERMSEVTDPSLIPGYRGYMCMFLGGVDERWGIGSSPQVQNYSFECSSYPASGFYGTQIGDEANPADVIYDLLTGTLGKLSLSTALIDSVTFTAAATTLYNEGHGYSRAIDNLQTADEIIGEILQQIDAVIYEDPSDSLIKIKLVRADYDPLEALSITTENCQALTNAAAGGWTGRTNKVRIVFTDRANSYSEGSATSQNQANAVGQNGIVEETILQMPGVCTQELADDLAGRELAALSRPIFKCSAQVDRTFLRTVPGDVVSLSWPLWNISNLMMRVAGVTRGTNEDGTIRLDLLQDLFYVHRGIVVSGDDHGSLGGFPGGLLG